jgi:DHA2 family multidrug resistance protein
MIGFTADTSQRTIVATSIIQGFGLGFIFVPLNTVAFSSLAPHLRTDGTAILTLVRNVASSVGISYVIANLTSGTTVMRSQLAESITVFNEALKSPDLARYVDIGTDQGRAIVDQILNQQAMFIAYGNDFKLLMWLAIASMPFVFAIGKLRGKKPAGPAHAALD